jgi:hypothetical protein
MEWLEGTVTWPSEPQTTFRASIAFPVKNRNAGEWLVWGKSKNK